MGGAFAAAAFAGPVGFADPKPGGGKKNPIGLQLSTLVKSKADVGSLEMYLKLLSGIGFNEVEPWHVVYAIPAEQLRTMIFNDGLAVTCGHFEYADLSADLPGQVRYAQALGLKWMLCPMLPHEQWGTADGFHKAAVAFNGWARQVRDAGMGFAFHNHDYEFRRFGGQTGFDILVEETDAELVSFELDCYWLTQAGEDPVKMMDRLGKRVRMLHVKDRKGGYPFSFDMSERSAHFTEVGRGAIDWHAVLRRAEELGVEHYFIEQDEIVGPPIASLKKSYDYLRGVLG